MAKITIFYNSYREPISYDNSKAQFDGVENGRNIYFAKGHGERTGRKYVVKLSGYGNQTLVCEKISEMNKDEA